MTLVDGRLAGRLGLLALRTVVSMPAPLRAAAVRLQLVGLIGPAGAVRRQLLERRLDRLGRGRVQDSFYSRVWEEAADLVGAHVDTLPEGGLRIRRGRDSILISRKDVRLNNPAAIQLAADKPRASSTLDKAGLQVPANLGFDVRGVEPAIDFLRAQEGPCVIKPASDTGGGAGVTGGIERPSDLVRAALKASRWASELLIERQAPGRLYRLLLLDGELLDVIKRVPAAVEGDGRSTISRLICHENDSRLADPDDIGYVLRPDLETILALRGQDLTMSSVPAGGVRVQVKVTTSQSGPLDTRTYRGDLSEAILRDARRAAELVGLRFAGVDVITPDPSKPLEETGGIIVELNGEPGLQHHYQVARPREATRVAIPILERLLAESPTFGG